MLQSDESDHVYWLHVFTAYAMQALIQKGDPMRVSHIDGVAERAVHIATRTLNELESRLGKMGDGASHAAANHLTGNHVTGKTGTPPPPGSARGRDPLS